MSDTFHRYEYERASLSKEDLFANPLELLRAWIEDATKAAVLEPTAMVLSTVAPTSAPSSRVVLLRMLLDTGLVFFTNYESKKGKELAENPRAAANFWWAAMERQVRIEGDVTKVDTAVSDEYFASRPKASQAASAASPQSSVLENSLGLHARMEALLSQDEIERPSHWGGYILEPKYFEFWQGGRARLHDRFCYRGVESGWIVEQLAP